jgi:hypothetical protein
VKPELVRMRHPDLGDREITVAPAGVPLRRAAGWVIAPDPPSPDPEPETDEPEKATPRRRRTSEKE